MQFVNKKEARIDYIVRGFPLCVLGRSRASVDINLHYSQIFYSKAKLPVIIDNSRILFSSK